MSNDILMIGNIQRICFHDGPGIRTTVFLKGCPLKCPWCANPENLTLNIEYLIDIDKCSNKKCPYGIICDGYQSSQNMLSKNIEKCPLNAIKSTGYCISIGDLLKELLIDKVYYKEKGGVTFSGGEPLFQANELQRILKKLKQEKIHTCVETSLGVKKEQLIKVIDFVDLFIVDIKILLKNAAKNLINLDIEEYLNNVDTLFSYSKSVIFRIPVIDNYTYTEQNIEKIIELLKKYNPLKVEMFKNHNLAEKKYFSLKKEYLKIAPIADDKINEFMKKIEKLGIEVEIIKF